MAVTLHPVYSSHIGEAGYDAEDRALHVVFKTGRRAVYRGVPPEVADNVLSAPSIGEALNNTIKGVYEFGYV